MKKLNRKGFTLVELLAVIVILAIVVGIAIPSVTSIINGSKNSAMGTAVATAADYLSDQFGYYNTLTSSSDSVFQTTFAGKIGKYVTLNSATAADKTVLQAMGLNPDNVTSVKACVDDKGKAYVEIVSIPNTSEYYTVTYWTNNGTTAATGAKNKAGNASCTAA